MALNLMAVAVTAVVSFAIGFAWYTPMLFGNAWMKLMNMSKKDIEKAQKEGMAQTMVIALVAQFVTTYVIALIVSWSGAVDFVSGAIIGFWLWLGLNATVLINSVLWEKKPMKLYFINTGQYLVVFCLTAAVLSVWV